MAESDSPPRRRRRHPLRTTLVVAVLAGLIGGVWYWSDHRPPAGGPGGSHRGFRHAAGGSRPQPVRAASVRTMDLHVWLDALGTVTPRNLVTVHARVDGTLDQVLFEEGQMVREGMLLAQIDPRPFQIQLDQASGQLARDQALLENARLDLKRYRGLLREDSISKQQVDTQAALVHQYEGTVAADRGQVESAKLQLQWTRIVAPSSGRIGLRQVDPGNQVHTGDPDGLATIAQLRPIDVVFAVPQSYLPAITRRLAGSGPVPVEAWDRDRQQRLAQGRVLTTDNQIDTATGTIRVKARFPNTDHALFPNQFVNVRLLLDTLHRTTALPQAAVQRSDKGSFVYRVDAGGSVSEVPVTAGAVDGDWQAVSGALRAGDRVVIDGADRLRAGAKVEVIEPGTETPGADRGQGAVGPSRNAGGAHRRPPAAAGTAHRSGSPQG